MNSLTAPKFNPVCSGYTAIHESLGFCVYIEMVFVTELVLFAELAYSHSLITITESYIK